MSVDEEPDEKEDARGDEVVDAAQALLDRQPVRAEDLPTQGIAPAIENSVKRQSGMRATPAGTEMNVRTTGSIREKNTVAEP